MSSDSLNTLQEAISSAFQTINNAYVQKTVEDLKIQQPASPEELAKYVDHTLLKLDATEEQIDGLCAEARGWGFKTVCVRLPFVERCKRNLAGTDIGIACVVGFHEGTYSTKEKVQEATAALAAGATELDIVLDHPLFTASYTTQASNNSDPSFNPMALSIIHDELTALRILKYPASSPLVGRRPTLKLIIETSALSKAASGGDSTHYIIGAAALAHAAEFEFIKTSTGFAGHGAKESHVKVMRAAAFWLDRREGREGERRMQVKASGGIRTLADAREMIAAGAGRLGVSAGVAIVREAREGGKVEGGGGGGY